MATILSCGAQYRVPRRDLLNPASSRPILDHSALSQKSVFCSAVGTELRSWAYIFVAEAMTKVVSKTRPRGATAMPTEPCMVARFFRKPSWGAVGNLTLRGKAGRQTEKTLSKRLLKGCLFGPPHRFRSKSRKAETPASKYSA